MNDRRNSCIKKYNKIAAKPLYYHYYLFTIVYSLLSSISGGMRIEFTQ